MPQIFDNIEQHLLPTLCEAIGLSERADFCVGYFNLRGWRQLDCLVDKWPGGDGHCCRLLVGMQQMPQDQLRSAMSLLRGGDEIDQGTAIALKRKLAQDFREQLMVGIPTNEDETGLRRLAAQIESGKMVVKLFLRHPLHAKLYLLFRQDPLNPKIGYLGSSNLTLAGLSKQGELNVDVMDRDACDKLGKWFEDRWADRFCLDISKELVEIINSSWARAEPIPPYHIYVKMAYHLSQEARAGLNEFRKAPGDRQPELDKLLGKVPYLNGGFFEVHQLEERNTDIDIPDKAFEKLFDFFDQYSWHLDERPLRADNEINPDVVGYIFEKYINQKQMGAYYLAPKGRR